MLRHTLASSGRAAGFVAASAVVAVLPPVALDAKPPQLSKRNTRSGRFESEGPGRKARSGRPGAEGPSTEVDVPSSESIPLKFALAELGKADVAPLLPISREIGLSTAGAAKSNYSFSRIVLP